LHQERESRQNERDAGKTPAERKLRCPVLHRVTLPAQSRLKKL
jgi:hypothetical protein